MFVMTANRTLLFALFAAGLITSYAAEKSDSINKTLSDIVVDGLGTRNVRSTDMGRTTLSRDQILKMPVLLSEPDIIKTLQLQPGVSQGMEAFAGLYVHGGEDDQNLFLFDGLPLYQVSHLGGLFSSFNVAAVSEADFYKTSFPVQFGGRTSSITDITMQTPNKEKYTGQLSLGLTSGNIFISGPLVKHRTAMALGIRRTWIDAISAPTLAIMNAIDKPNGKKTIANYQFTDLNFKIDHSFRPNVTASIMAYYSHDRLKFGERRFQDPDEEKGNSGYYDEHFNKFGWGNYGISGTFKMQSSHSQLHATVYWSKYSSDYLQQREYQNDIEEALSYGKITDSTNNWISDIGAKLNFSTWITSRFKMLCGAEWVNHNYLPEDLSTLSIAKGLETRFNSYSGNINAQQLSLWAGGELSPSSRISLNLGVRLANFWSQGENHHILEPRATLRVSLNDDLSLKMGYAKMSQFAQQVSNNHVSLPTDLWQPIPAGFKPMTSHQYSIGAYKNFSSSLLFSAEAWYKRTYNILEYRDGISMLNPLLAWNEKLTSGKGWAYGIDLSLRKTVGRLSGSIGYGLMWNWRKFAELNEGKRFPAKFDNRHKINIVASYNFSPSLCLSASWVYTTGNRMTMSLYNYDTSSGFFPDAPSNGYGDIGSDKVTGVGSIAGRNNVRLPAYHRLDLALSYTKNLKNGRKSVWNVSLYNAYCHMNAITIQKDDFNNKWGHNGGTEWHRSFKTFSLIPIVPSASYTYYF